MNNISLNLSGKIKPAYLDVLSLVKRVADSLGIPFFLIGATARDFILAHFHGIKTSRMTRDIDFGFEIADWDQFGKLTDALLATGEIIVTKEKQRFLFGNIPVDIIPFGPIVDAAKRISWPPEHEIFMSMLGFDEAYKYSVSARLSSEPELVIKIPTLAGLSLMKLVSWDERYPAGSKDAEDLLFIMQHYDEAGNTDRLYEEEILSLAAEGFDNRLAGIKLLGKDMVRIASPETATVIKGILARETSNGSPYRLIIDMDKSNPLRNKFDLILQYVEKLQEGFCQT
jgi:predicted nucleotidyltransferase